MTGTPSRVDLRPWMPPVRDQGQRNTCLVFAVTAAHEAARAVTFSIDEDLAEEGLYWASKRIDSDGRPGTKWSSVKAALLQTGQPSERAWPYQAAQDENDGSYAPPAGAMDPSIWYRARLERAGATVERMRQLLSVGQPIAASFRITSSFFDAPNGVIPLPLRGEPFLSFHAVLLVGYDDMAEGGVWIFRNSWGEEWGDRGYGYLPYEYIERFGAQAWVIELF